MTSPQVPPGTTRSVRSSISIVLMALAPLWLTGLFDRELWTPDEPRESDIAWNMTRQADHTLPQLAGMPFLEKPPLSYWLSALALRALGPARATARAPNLLYAGVTLIAVGMLAHCMGGAAATLVAALGLGSALLTYRVGIWLAPDASLLAGCAVSLLGIYLGYTAAPGRRKLAGYTLMHAGAALGFMAKSAPGWLVPALTLATLIVWERRWSELRRAELYAGVLLQALVIGPWIAAVALRADGAAALRVLFWNNVVGRFTQVAASPALDYTLGHANFPGKYLLELPVGLLPWTLLILAAVWRAWPRTRARDGAATHWRFAIAASLPLLALLSLASTARDIYAAPVTLGLALLGALWAGDAAQRRSRFDDAAFAGTSLLVALLALLLAVALVVLAGTAPTRTAATVGVVASLATLGVCFVALRRARRAYRAGTVHRALGCIYVAFVGPLTLGALAAFPAIDRWQNLPALAQRIERDTAGDDLALLDPDETTIAMLDDRQATPFTRLTPGAGGGRESAQLVRGWLATHAARGRVLVLLPGHASGELTPLLRRIGSAAAPGDGTAGALIRAGTVREVARYELPHGRRYALLGLP